MDSFLKEDDSDDSLPPISELIQLPTEFLEGQIVWAKYKKFYWPSLIRKVYKKEKKVSLWYLDSVSKTFKVAFKNLHRYNDIDFGQKVKRAVSASPLKNLHDKVLEATMDYVFRRSDGIKDDPVEFFARNVPKESLPDKVASAKQPCKVDSKISESFQKSLNETFKDSDEESVTDSEDEQEKRKQRMEVIAELSLADEEYCPEPRVNAMVACITTGHVDKYLMDIISHKVPSVRQQTFEEFVQQKKNIMWQGNSFPIHIKDDSKVKAIYDYLESYYERAVAKGKWSMFKYVTNVWMPEAMIEALKLVDSGWTPGPAPSAKNKLFTIDEDASVEEEKDRPKATSRKPKGKKATPNKKSNEEDQNSETELRRNGWASGPASSAKRKLLKIDEDASVEEEKDRPKATSRKPKGKKKAPNKKEQDQNSETVLKKSPRNKNKRREE